MTTNFSFLSKHKLHVSSSMVLIVCTVLALLCANIPVVKVWYSSLWLHDVSVAIGELAAGLQVDLDKVPKKYAGLDGTELAISESQERMAVVVDPKDVEEFLGYASEENLEAIPVAVVTEDPRLVLNWRGKNIVNLKRAFLETSVYSHPFSALNFKSTAL